MSQGHVRIAAFVAGVVLVLAGCGREDTGGAVGTGTNGGTAVPVDVALVIDVTNSSGQTRHATITCQGGAAYGTGYLIEPVAAGTACKILRKDQAVIQRLTAGPNPGQACTQQYGGPQVATITGTLAGHTIDTRVDRKDGCGIADWDHFQLLVGPAD